MCGIVGVFSQSGEPVMPRVLRAMADAIAHRGPDGEGFFTDSFVGLGHRRLAILDLSPRGHQPMQCRSGDIVLTYNGEIYNFQELRLELEALGHEFHSRTDTEVVLHAYKEWGSDALNRFNGMFALAIWDKRSQELFLARDRYGIKPLYYTFCDRKFVFASEQKAILEFPGMRRDVDYDGLLEYFTFQNFVSDRTLLAGIKMFPAGSYAILKLGDQQLQLKPIQFWDFQFQEPTGSRTRSSYLEELAYLFKQAVNRQLISDVELGAYLSGGMDSGSIAAIAARQLPYLKTFTCGFDLTSASGLELAFDERKKAEHMSYLFKTEHYEMVLKAGDMERIIPKLAVALEEPRVGQSYPNYYVAQLASKFVKVVLSGAGGDEIFGGYPWRYYRAVHNDNFDDYIENYFSFWHRLIPDHVMQGIFSPVRQKFTSLSAKDTFRSMFQQAGPTPRRPEDYINQSLYFEAKTFLHGLLVVEDKFSMAHSLETRVPFLDNDLVDFGMRLPTDCKLADIRNVVRRANDPGETKNQSHFQKTSDGKILLRKMMEDIIPPSITQAAKQGFSAPDASWFKGESIDYVRRRIGSKTARIYEFMDFKAVHNLVSEHLEGKSNRRLLIWSLLNFEEWCHQFLPT